MIRPAVVAVLISLATASVQGAPITLKELQFLIRQGTPEAEVVHEVTQRRLLIPLDAAATQSLKEAGAGPSLIAKLAAPGLVVPAQEAQVEMQRQRANQARMQQEAAQDSARHEAQQKQREQISQAMLGKGTIVEMLEDKLVKLNGDELKPVSARDLRDVRIFAFYQSAMWCGPCRQVTPKLVQAYHLLKQRYPTQFEVVLISQDRDEFNMHEYMRSEKMPWPAVKFGQGKELSQQYAGTSIPWLVLVAENGKPLTTNGVDKKYVQPAEIISALDQLLGQLKP